jgi:hypothetical protein
MRVAAPQMLGWVAMAAVPLLLGCAEATFLLAKDSRLPAWVEVPPGLSRQDLSVQMDYYVLPSGREAQFKVRDSRGQKMGEKRGKLSGLEPLKFGESGYPLYEIITVDGVSEVIEHRAMGPIFFVSDDPAVRKQLRVLSPKGR